ncbi:MAG TPA: cyanophycin synthetase [Gemmatimonadaceae bacterium]|nr:cyanophycin synthetase [Gemmatimonadaceae bacterium]
MSQPDVVPEPISSPAPELDIYDLRVSRLRAMRGPNPWRLAPVVACEVLVTGTLARITPAGVPGFADRMRAAIAEVAAHPDSCAGSRDHDFIGRLHDGAEPRLSWAEVLQQVALELQCVAGTPVSFGRVAEPDETGAWTLAVEYVEEEVGLESVRQALALVRDCITDDRLPDAPGVVTEMRRTYERSAPGPTMQVLIDAARRRGIPVRPVPDDYIVQIGLGRGMRRLDATMTDFTSVIATDITSDKDRTKRFLERVGLPVPRGSVARTAEEALEIAEEIGFPRLPVLLKPLDANNGRGISAAITTEEQLRTAWERAVAEHPKVVVERYVTGHDHRVVVVAGKVVAVAERVPAHVVGDGRRTVRELIVETNRDPRRGKGPQHPLAPLPADELTREFLARGGRTLDSVPDEGEAVYLRSTANISTGGTPIDRTDEMHPDNVTACEMAAHAVGLDVAGLDVLTPDIGVPFKENGAVIIEVNASPGIRMHTHPVEGKARDVPGAILDMLYPPGTPTTIPLIAVTGTNGKTTTTRLIAHLFGATGKVTGYTTTDGVYLRNRLVMEGDMTGPFAANIILSNPTVEVAVLETARGGILRAGLGFDECDVGVVLNVTPDHLGLRGINTVEQLAEVKALIPAVVKPGGFAVLNADDPLVYAMRERTRGSVALFSARGEGDNPAVAEHLAAGGVAALVQGDMFVVRRGKLCIPVAKVADVPLTMGGAARFQFENILGATAAAFVQGMPYEEIRAGLLSFVPSASVMPGRMNLLRVGRGRVIVDYAHNPAAVAGLVDFVMRLDAGRRVAAITAPGDRRDEDLRAVGRAFAGFDHVILKEAAMYRRGRREGEIAERIAEGLAEGGMSPLRATTIYDERRAVERAVDAMGENGIAVILADDFNSVLEQLRPLVAGV